MGVSRLATKFSPPGVPGGRVKMKTLNTNQNKKFRGYWGVLVGGVGINIMINSKRYIYENYSMDQRRNRQTYYSIQ